MNRYNDEYMECEEIEDDSTLLITLQDPGREITPSGYNDESMECDEFENDSTLLITLEGLSLAEDLDMHWETNTDIVEQMELDPGREITPSGYNDESMECDEFENDSTLLITLQGLSLAEDLDMHWEANTDIVEQMELDPGREITPSGYNDESMECDEFENDSTLLITLQGLSLAEDLDMHWETTSDVVEQMERDP
ncbi:hypothetical protein J6590_064279 [Homalodisca vitripennis]|nr:hypothetical protein J6590_064279 [Homalodisca vitripennis]